MKELSQVSHYPRETAIRIDCIQLGKILTQTQTYLRQGSLRSPLVQLRYTFYGFDQRRTIRDSTGCQDDQDYTALGLTSGSSYILTTSSVRTLIE